MTRAALAVESLPIVKSYSFASFERKKWRFMTALMLSTSLIALHLYATPSIAQSQPRQQNFSIASQPLSSALLQFANVRNIDIFFDQNEIGSKNAVALNGSYSIEEGLRRLFTGTGLSWRFQGGRNVTVYDPSRQSTNSEGLPVSAEGTTLLDTITVTGGGGENSVYSPYETAAATSYISGENIERFRGSSPSDIFRGTPGVLSGDSRSSAGAIDVNVRGLQGMGRVRVTVDDAENAVTVYNGYQGQSNRTYIDSDLIAGIDIKKGADAASRGMAGTVAMRTLSATDIVKEDNTWGVRLKGEFGTNQTSPTAGSTAGYSWPSTGDAVASADGMGRPSFLTPGGGTGSAVAAIKQEEYDFLVGYGT